MSIRKTNNVEKEDITALSRNVYSGTCWLFFSGIGGVVGYIEKESLFRLFFFSMIPWRK